IGDELIKLMKEIDSTLDLSYRKNYIGLARNGLANNFVQLFPKKNNMTVSIKMEQSPEVDEKLEKVGIDVIDYNKKRGRYKIRLSKAMVLQNSELITSLLKAAYNTSNNLLE